MRKAKACAACRKRRRKCEVRAPGSPCVYCLMHRQSCTNGQVPNKVQFEDGRSLPSASGLEDTDHRGMTSQSLCVELVRLYFDFIHDQFHSLFHQPSFEEDLSLEKAPMILVYGMMALSARFSTNPVFSNVDPRERGKDYAKECELLVDWNDISLTTIQACVLLGAIAITQGRSATENVYYAVACRIAQLLDLPNHQCASLIEQEVNIRVWWTLCMIDVWSSTGVRLPRLLSPKENVPLPMDELAFLQLSRNDCFDIIIKNNSKSSLLAEMVRLNRILQQINDFNIQAVEVEPGPDSIMTYIEDLSGQLDVWLKELPDHIRDTRENLNRFAALGLGRMFVAIYLGYYHFGQMLFYRFLHEDSQTEARQRRYYAKKCKQHASNLCDIVYASEEVSGCDAKYNMVGHVLLIASTVQIHSLLFENDDIEVARSRSRLEKNFCILSHLCQLWPTLDVCMDRLMAFHRACRESADTSFRMDRWMVRFLVEFATPLKSKNTSQDHNANALSLARLDNC